MEEALDDGRSLGPAGLEAWEAMTGPELPEQLKRTLGIHPTSAQLGTLCQLFDVNSIGGIEKREFLSAFFKINMAAKSLLGTKDAVTSSSSRQSGNEMSERIGQGDDQEQETKMLHLGELGAAAMLLERRKTSRRGKGGLGLALGTVKAKGPADATGKVRARVASARSSERLDLSTPLRRSGSDFLLRAAPRSIWRMAHLKELWLTNNELPTLSPGLGGLTSLRLLCLTNNALTHLPPEIGQLRSLRRLFLGRNRLTTLPAELEKCTQVSELRLCANPLGHVPDAVCELRRLTVLSMQDCGISELPDRMKKCRLLLEVDLENNPLRGVLPEPLRQLPSLVTLRLAGTGVRNST